MPKFYNDILERNRKWAAEKVVDDPNYFTKLAKGQKPPLLWIGCSDSRVPANELTGTKAGEVFVHRNIANMVVHTDMSMLSVLDYAVNVLEVEHVIVCGHYGCGGIKAAMSNEQFGLIDNWLLNIKDVYRIHQKELESIKDLDARTRRMVELNVKEQVYDLGHTSIIQNAWKNRKRPHLHGWVYELKTGLVKDLNVSMCDASEFKEVYKTHES